MVNVYVFPVGLYLDQWWSRMFGYQLHSQESWVPGYINSPVNAEEKNHLERIIKQLTFH